MKSLKSTPREAAYPKPGPLGGTLIREIISTAKSQKLKLPLDSHILIGASGGSDSVGLAHLIIHFGRRIVPRAQISLLHVNHGWRGEDSDADQNFVENLGAKWKIPVMVHRISGAKNHDSKKSWEDEARILRKDIFALEAQKHQALVFTAHHADDQAETMLWRLFTGAAHTHGGGVAFHHKNEVRPLLRVRKAQIKNYLKEVGQDYREDSTNQSATFLRARMRSELMPQLERIFPRAVDQLVKLALSAQLESGSLGDTPNAPYDILFKAAGLKPRRPHFEILSQKLVANKSWCGEVHLPGGWILKRLSPDKWILERT